MAKVIYTERDVEDLARRGIKDLVLTDDVYLTDVARERAEKVGIALKKPGDSSAASAAVSSGVARVDGEQVVSKVKADVIAKLGPTVDPALIDRIVRRVVSQLK